MTAPIEEREQAALTELRDLLNSDEALRIEFSESFSLSSSAVFVSARFSRRRPSGSWAKVGPVVVAPTENPTRAGLLDTLAHLAKGDGLDAEATR